MTLRVPAAPNVLTGSVTDKSLRAMADPLRARIVELLADEQLCTCHLVELTGARQTNVVQPPAGAARSRPGRDRAGRPLHVLPPAPEALSTLSITTPISRSAPSGPRNYGGRATEYPADGNAAADPCVARETAGASPGCRRRTGCCRC